MQKYTTKESLLELYNKPLLELVFEAATVHRLHHNPREVQMSSLLSIKTGGCPEDCGYCPQAARYHTDVEAHKLMSVESVIEQAQNAKSNGSSRLCMGAAWREVRDNKDFDNVIEVNLKSVFNMTKAVQRTMLKQRHGSLIHMSSVVGVKGNAGQSNYAASKAGIIGFSKSIALELGSRNIRSNVIAPGFIETEMTDKLPEDVVAQWRAGIPLKRGGSPDDVANACLFLAADLSAYITGQVLHVDGGMLT